ncbi:HpsJ family protein [Phormidesmis priestleyi]|uniref:HpsJ-like protein, cyanoexosortase C-associated n=1 Tax=Phormidesmis priestleyi TaxID=268141 RepID=UPI00083B2F44|nr:HpsJ family protein [Phormidesmis priestleyi]
MTTVSSQSFAPVYSSTGLCRIVGVACIAGFIFDVLALAIPPAFGNIEWRIALFQQIGDRSIILLFGLALLTYGSIETRRLRKRLAIVCLVLGVLFNLSCVLVIRDGLSFQERAVNTISAQASTLQSQIQAVQPGSTQGKVKVTSEDIQKASQALTQQATSLKQNAKTGIVKTSLSSIGNLVIVGIALIGLGQYGNRPSKA